MSLLERLPPYDFGDPAARDLWLLLAQNYQTRYSTLDVLDRARIDSVSINVEQAPQWVWRDILLLAHQRGKLGDLLAIVSAEMDSSVATRITELVAISPVAETPSSLEVGEWRGGRSDPVLERITMSQSTLLDVAFLRRGLELASSVCRLLVTLDGKPYYGTAFRISHDSVLTSYHNLYADAAGRRRATTVEAWFGFEKSFEGAVSAPTVVPGDPDSIAGDKNHDWAVIKLTDGISDDISRVSLDLPSEIRVDERVYIIQHPSGQPKRIGMIHNVVRFVDKSQIQYLTDTEGGSSGSPVFNEMWQLVAIHQGSTTQTLHNRTEVRNHGRRIEPVADALRRMEMI